MLVPGTGYIEWYFVKFLRAIREFALYLSLPVMLVNAFDHPLRVIFARTRVDHECHRRRDNFTPLSPRFLKFANEERRSGKRWETFILRKAMFAKYFDLSERK